MIIPIQYVITITVTYYKITYYITFNLGINFYIIKSCMFKVRSLQVFQVSRTFLHWILHGDPTIVHIATNPFAILKLVKSVINSCKSCK
jgi:hypothetical protein